MTPIDDARAALFLTAVQMSYVMQWLLRNAEKTRVATQLFMGMSLVQITRWADVTAKIITEPTVYHPPQRSIFY